MKLKYKLSILIFLLIIVTAGANYFLLTGTFKVLQIKRLESAEVLLGQSLAQKIYRQVIEGDREAVIAVLFKEKILREKKLSYLVVYDRPENLFAHTYLDEFPNQLRSLENSFDHEREFRIDDLLDSSLQVYNIAIPIREGIIQVGTLHIGIDRQFIAEAASPLQTASTLILLFGAFFVVIGAGVAFGAGFAITQSLERLEAVAVRLSQGDFGVKIDGSGKDEVGRLARAFGRMRDSIQDAQKKLEQQNENLEVTVQERTQELEENHRKLEQSYEQMRCLNEDLDTQRKNLKIVFSAMTYPMYVVNLDHSIAMMNDVAEEKSRNRPLSLATCYSMNYGTDKPCDSTDQPCTLKQVVATKKSVILEKTLSDSKGKTYTVEVHGYPIFDEKGDVIQIVESFIDISEKKKAQEEQLRLERELSKTGKLEAIGTLAAGVAHEINTPVQFIGDNTRFTSDSIADLFSAIKGYESLLGSRGEESKKDIQDIRDKYDLDYLEEELPVALAQTLEGTLHVTDIVKAMKDFSHTGSDEKQYHDINDALKTTVTISKNEWKYSAEIELQLAANLPQVKCFLGELKQVFLNLLVNATHAIQLQQNKTGRADKGSITVRSEVRGEDLFVSVTDTGTGIAPEHQDRIFDHFYTTKEVGKGSGQGLSVAYQIVCDKHSGKIWFETELEKGSTFYVQLPLHG